MTQPIIHRPPEWHIPPRRCPSVFVCQWIRADVSKAHWNTRQQWRASEIGNLHLAGEDTTRQPGGEYPTLSRNPLPGGYGNSITTKVQDIHTHGRLELFLGNVHRHSTVQVGRGNCGATKRSWVWFESTSTWVARADSAALTTTVHHSLQQSSFVVKPLGGDSAKRSVAENSEAPYIPINNMHPCMTYGPRLRCNVMACKHSHAVIQVSRVLEVIRKQGRIVVW